MTKRQPLPRLMVAPTGARRSKSDHPALPIEINELVETAVACRRAGAEGLHLHVRDENGEHCLDVGRYQEAIAEIEHAVPDLFLEVTSESAGRFGPSEQIEMIRKLRPGSISLALSELLSPPIDKSAIRDFYCWAHDEGVGVHHIAYSPAELRQILDYVDERMIPGEYHQLQLVIGSYAGFVTSHPRDLEPYLELINSRKDDLELDWMTCAFGPTETASLAYAAARGGKVRVGFENSIWNADGSIAKDNAERVAEVRAVIDTAAQNVSTSGR